MRSLTTIRRNGLIPQALRSAVNYSSTPDTVMAVIVRLYGALTRQERRTDRQAPLLALGCSYGIRLFGFTLSVLSIAC